MSEGGVLLDVEHVSRTFGSRRRWFRRAPPVRAVDDVSFRLAAGETLALVGESGCGKTTTARLIMRLIEPSAGRILFEGVDLASLAPAALRQARRQFQIVFQDPFASLSPRERVLDVVAEPLQAHGVCRTRAELRERVGGLLERVGLDASHMDRYPHEFSGGQRQRIGIARGLALHPKLIVADEPVSALDVSVQSQVINLMQDLQDELGMAYLVVAHDLAVVRHIAHRVAVMYLGRIVELGDKDAVFHRPHHPYTQALLSAAPVPDPRRRAHRIVLQGDVPSPARPPAGCHFHPRCPIARQICREAVPLLESKAPGHEAACHFARPLPIPVGG
jgi:peptide/nickel transport system ATP-binding protein/oligopeptide transport system ATP-binding protein